MYQLVPILMSKITATFILIIAVALGLAAPASADRAEVVLQFYGMRNISQGQNGYSQNVEANVKDEVEFSLVIIAISSVTARDVRVNVYLPFGMRVVADSMKINGASSNNNAVNNGVVVGDIGTGEQKTVTFRAIPGNNLEGFYGIQGQVSGGNTGTTTKTVVMNILSQTATLIPTSSLMPIPTSTPVLTPRSTSLIKTKIVHVYAEKENVTVVKVGRNVTAGQRVPTREVGARPGEELEFSVQITSASDKEIRNIIVKDTLPEQIEYVPGSARVDNQMIGDQIFREGVSLSRLRPKETKTVGYQARLLPKDSFQKVETELKNIFEVKTANANLTTASASIFVKKDRSVLLGGVLALAGFTSYLLILLAALATLFFTFWIQEKRRPRLVPPMSIDSTPSMVRTRGFEPPRR